MAKATENKIKVSELIPDNKNFNKGSEFGNSLISKSFEKFGAGRSILIDKNNKIIAGNKSTENYGAGGGEDVIVVESDGTKLIAVKRTDIDLDTPEGRELALADNATAKANIVWAEDVIASELGVEVGESWGVDMGKEIPEAEEDDFDTTPPEDPKTVLGDLYEIGEHRLLCGSSTEADAVGKLLNGDETNIMCTDPPYGVNLDQSWRDEALGDKALGKGNKNVVIDDDIADWTDAYSLFTGNIAYVWHASKFTDVIMSNLRDCNLIPNQQIIWNKSVMVMGRCDYHFKHEPCWYAVRKNKGHDWIGDRKQTTIIDAAPPNHIMAGSKEERTSHPTQKPVDCMAMLIKNHSGNVYDPFLGSGTTMVAAHQLNRKCYGMELDPKYCDVIVKRMITLDPTLTIKLNGVDVTNEWKS